MAAQRADASLLRGTMTRALLPPCCSLDTGRLNPETYRLFDKVEKHYGIRIEYTFPDAQVSPPMFSLCSLSSS